MAIALVAMPATSPTLHSDSPSPLNTKAPRKTSLGYILSPPSPVFSNPSSSATASRPNTDSSTSTAVYTPTLSGLPIHALTQIAYLLVVDPSSPTASHPANLLPLLFTCRGIYKALSLHHNPRLYSDLYDTTFDTAAITRRYAWISGVLERQSGGKKRAFDLFGDGKAWAKDYRARWAARGRMREVVRFQSLDGDPNGNGAVAEHVLADLWTIWFIVTENDGKNLAFLKEQCLFPQWLAAYYAGRLLKESALTPGYSPVTAENSLGIWCAILSGIDLIRGLTPERLDETIFMLRPYVFACSKYDISYGPWRHRQLPLCPPGCTCTQHSAELSVRGTVPLPYERFGYIWRRPPPQFIPGAYLTFLRLLQRQAQGLDTPLAPLPDIRPSERHDREWQRMSVCQDPHVSAGLPAMSFAGAMVGGWKGQFLFYSLEQYREVVAGDMRAVYTGDFGAQGMELQIKETIVKVRIGEEGGKGGLFSAGYKEFDDDEPAVEGENAEQRRIRLGYGNQVVDPEEEDEEGWTKEILLYGRAKSNWGWSRLRGRIRAWDGLVSLHMVYEQTPRHPMGRWLWRGYLHTGDYFIGRWRDTFTPENHLGHEGAFGMFRIPEAMQTKYPSSDDPPAAEARVEPEAQAAETSEMDIDEA